MTTREELALVAAEASLRRTHPTRHDVSECDGCAVIAIIDALRATVARQAEVIAAAQQNTLVFQPVAGVAGTPLVARYGACTHPRATVTPPATAGEPMTYCPDCGGYGTVLL